MLRGIGKHSSGRKQYDKATLLCASTTSACYVIGRRGIWYGFLAPCQPLQLSGGSLFSRKRSWEQTKRHLIGQHTGVQTHLGGFLGWHVFGCFSSACSLSLQLSWLSSFQKHCFHSPLCSLSLPSFQAAKDTPMVMVSSALLMLIVEGFRAIETCIVNRFRA